ncbi:MAG TPA: GvpL/GvpF family gas vesicle protein [Streptosporangiaceae bacterium]|nr:GvpL/GvpF family gas vesicle protein [Streptosporangiaceae bacterium]
MPATQETRRPEKRVGCYVYGILPHDVELTPDSRGIGDRDVSLVRHGQIAALVSEVPLDSPLGTPEDLAAHQRLLDAAAVAAPVLPIKFGAVLANADDVAEELLAANHDEFRDALNQMEGRVEYLLKARYVERTILGEILSENSEAARLREEIRGEAEETSRDAKIRLGEMINEGIAAKRAADTREAVEILAPYSVATNEREPTHREDAAHVAFLVETEKAGRFEEAAADLVRTWRGRADVRLLGPLAPYDFVVTSGGGG